MGHCNSVGKGFERGLYRMSLGQERGFKYPDIPFSSVLVGGGPGFDLMERLF